MTGVLLVIPITTWSNDIYIAQVGDTLDLDIVQDGQDNKIGTGSQDVVLGNAGSDADDMTFNITQTGNLNTITAQILGATYTGVITVVIDASSSLSNTDSTLDIDVAGNGDTNGHTINFNATGRGHIVKFDQSGVYDNVIDLTTNGDGHNINITQSD